MVGNESSQVNRVHTHRSSRFQLSSLRRNTLSHWGYAEAEVLGRALLGFVSCANVKLLQALCSPGNIQLSDIADLACAKENQSKM